MLQFLSCESGVTTDLQSRIKNIILTNIDKLYDQDYPGTLQTLISQQLGGLWSVATLRGADQFEVKLASKDYTSMIIAYSDLRIFLTQAYTQRLVPPCSQDQLDERVQLVHRDCLERQLSMRDIAQELQEAVEAGTGPGVNVITFMEDAATQFEYRTAFGQLESESVCAISDDKNFRVLVFVTPTTMQSQAVDDEEQYEQEYIEKEVQPSNRVAEDDYEEPMKTVFRVFEEEQHFRQSSDQLKLSFDQLEINPVKLSSFTLLFQMSISPFPKEIKDDLNIISTGSSLMSKNIVMGLNKDSLFFLNFVTQQGKLETMYSQMKLKRNHLYQIALVFHNTDLYKELTLYINGSVENQVSLTQLIDIPRGFFWIGSEQALKLFKGMVRDVVFIAQPLPGKQVKSIYAEMSQSLQSSVIRTTADIIEELMVQKYYEPQDEPNQSRMDQTQSSNLKPTTFVPPKQKSKKNLIPIHLQKTHFIAQHEDNHRKKDEATLTQEADQQPKSLRDIAEQLSQRLMENTYLFNKCRELSLHFYWVFTTCWLFAPQFEEGEAPKLPFDYLHHALSKEKNEQYPVYALEIERFTKVIHYADIQLTREEILDIAAGTESLRKHKDYGYYVLYDRFLLATREATLQKEEIENIKAMYLNDEKDQDQDLLLVSNGIHRQASEPEPNFSFFSQLVKLIGSEQEAFKFKLFCLVAYYVNVDQTSGRYPNVQKLTAVYVHKENEQEVEVEGVEFFAMEEDKIFSQKLEVSEEVTLKYFRVHYTAPRNQISMVSFKTESQEETFLLDSNFNYQEGKDASGQLQTYPIEEGGRLAGFRGTIVADQGVKYLVSLHAEYLIKDPEVVRQKALLPEQLPTIPEAWNQGKFQVIVNRHQDSTAETISHWPSEIEFATRFNDLGTMLKEVFPNIELICNWDPRYQIEHFDVYIRGVGPIERRDRQGRIFIFKKFEKVKTFMDNFPKRMLRVYDELVLIAQAYGDTVELERVQEHYLKTQANTFQPRSKDAQDYPCSIPEKEERQEDPEQEKKKKSRR